MLCSLWHYKQVLEFVMQYLMFVLSFGQTNTCGAAILESHKKAVCINVFNPIDQSNAVDKGSSASISE